MSSARSLVVVSWTLLSAPALCVQIPVRALDSNGLFSSDSPARVRSGVAVGFGAGGSFAQGALWDSAGSHVLPPTAGNSYAAASDFNDAGDVVGGSVRSLFFASTATLWRGGVAIDVNTLVTGGPPLFLSTATAIDARGRIAGSGAPSFLAFPDSGYLLENGVVTDLGVLVGGTRGFSPIRMNDHLQIVGSADAGGSVIHAAWWDNGTLSDLHDPAQITGSSSAALAIDRFGRICGVAAFSVSPSLERESAVLWDHGVVTDLGVGVGTSSRAQGINDFGVVVGSYVDATLGARACIFENGGASDLNSRIASGSGWTLESANDVDGEGRIVGSGQWNGETRAFILEPDCAGTFTIYGSGCVGAVGVEPRLDGVGCPSPDRDFALFLHDGVPGSLGFSFIGASNGAIRVKPGCDLQVLPLMVPPILVGLDGFGEAWSGVLLPSGTPIFDVYLQSMFFAPGSRLISATKPLQLHFE